MKVTVHQKRFVKMKRAEKVILSFCAAPIILLMLLSVILALSAGALLFGIVLAVIWLLLIAGTIYASALPLQSGYLELTERITFHNVMGKYKHKKYEYREIAWLFVDYCPMQFTQRKGKNSYFTLEEWQAMYGMYIVALDSEQNILFICGYQQEVWEFLVDKCQDGIVRIMTAEEFRMHQQEQQKAAEEFCRKNGYDKEVSKYEGYIN